MGADLNTLIGMRASKISETNESPEHEDPSVSLLGPHGNATRNARGELIIEVMNHLQLRAASTLFTT